MEFEKYHNTLINDGVCLIKNYFSEEESTKIVNFANKLENLEEIKGKYMIFYEKHNDIKYKSRIENFLNYNEDINNFYQDKIVSFVNNITKQENSLLKDKMNWKIAGGKGFKAHQDQPAWTDFPPNKYYNVAIFGDICNKENGCLQYGFNKNNIKFNKIIDYNEIGSGELDKKIEENLIWKYFESNPKDILIFDSYIPHRSFNNVTDNSRRIFYFTFYEKKYGELYNDYFKKKRELFPPDIERTNNNIQIMNNKYNLANPIE